MTLLLLLLCDDFSKASADFKAALQNSNDTKLEKAIVEVVRDNSERAVKVLLSGLTTNNPRFYWLIITGMSKFLSKEAIGEIEKTILSKSQPGALRRDLMMALQLSTAGPADAAILKIAAEGTSDLQVTAIDEIVKRGLKDGIPILITIVKQEEKKGSELHRQATKALTMLTAQTLSSGEGWEAWWNQNKDTFKVGDAPKSEKGGTVVETIKRNRTTDYEDLKKGKKEEIVVVTGVYDEVQKVLEKLGIPHTVISKDDFDKHDFSKCVVLLVNCDDYNQKRFTKKQQEAVRNWVAQGGYLFTSDWGIVDLLEDAFPGYVKKAGEIPPQMNVDILPKKGSTGHPYLKEVFIKIKSEGGGGKSASQIEEKIDHRWEIDALSYTIGYDPSKVIVLCESPELLGTTKDNAVAVTFGYGDSGGGKPAVATGGVYEELPKMKGGKVLHILSHFGKQKNAQDDYALQNMLLNFLIEAKDRKRMAGGKKK